MKRLLALLAMFPCLVLGQQTLLINPLVQKGVIYGDPLYSTLQQQDVMNTALFSGIGFTMTGDCTMSLAAITCTGPTHLTGNLGSGVKSTAGQTLLDATNAVTVGGKTY